MVDLGAALAAAGCDVAEVDDELMQYCAAALDALEEGGPGAVTDSDVEAVCAPLEEFLPGEAFGAFVRAVVTAARTGAPARAPAPTPAKLLSTTLHMASDSDAVREAGAAAMVPHARLSIRAPASPAAAHSPPDVGAEASAPAPAAGAGGGDAPPPPIHDSATRVQELLGMVDWESGELATRGVGAAEAFAHVDDAAGNYTEGVLAASWRHTAKGGTSGASRDVSIARLTVANADGELISGAALRLQFGHKYGLVGRNGSGKSTLLRRMATGAIPGFPPHLRVVMIDAGEHAPGTTALAAVMAGDTRAHALRQLATALEDALAGPEATPRAAGDGVPPPPGLVAALAGRDGDTLSAALSAVYGEQEAAGEEGAEAAAGRALAQVGLPEARHGTPLAELSGGWRMRVAIAAALAQEPDVLLADEPSNHLDLEGVHWMGQYLAALPCTAVVVSHDAAFLDAFATDILHLHQRDLKAYPTDYTGFTQVRGQKADMMSRLQGNLERKRAHMEASAKRMEAAAAGNVRKAKASRTTKLKRHTGDENKSRQVAQRRHRLQFVGLDKTLDGKKFNAQKHGRRLGSAADNGGGWKDGKMTAASVATDFEEPVHFKFPGPEGAVADAPVVAAAGVSFRYPGATRDVLGGVEVNITTSTRMGIVGPNGAGKTTLLRMLAGLAEPTTGELTLGAGVRVAYFTQHHAEALDLDATPLEHLAALYPSETHTTLRGMLGAFGVAGYTPTLPMSALSGGQRSRVALAALFRARPHLLIADELTNFLDAASIEALCDGLKAYTGGVVLVSHNLQLLQAVCTEFHVVQDGTLTRLEGGLQQYLAEHAGPEA